MLNLFSLFLSLFLLTHCRGIDPLEQGQGPSQRTPVEWERPDPDDVEKKKKEDQKTKKKAEDDKKSSEDNKKNVSKDKKSSSSDKDKVANKNGGDANTVDEDKDAMEPLPPAGTRMEILDSVAVTQLMDVNSNMLKTRLEEFTGEVAVQVDGEMVTLGARNNAQGKQLARAYLKEHFEDFGFEVTEENYGTGINFVAYKKGLYEDRVLILGAHYDTVATVGADDDASGVIASLMIAEELKDEDLLYGLKVVFFDEEESGLIGSIAYVEELLKETAKEEIIGTVVLEMMGYDSDNNGAFHIVDCLQNAANPEGESAVLSQLLMDAVVTQGSVLQRTDACTDRSDHTAFWQQDLPAIVISQDFFGGDGNPCYHRDCDQTDMINFDYYEKLTELVGSSVSSVVVKKKSEK